MQLDGFDVIVGDVVFDTAFGAGVVASLRDLNDRFEVRFGDSRSALYTTSGIGPAIQRRTLYWADPVAFIPSKDPRRTRIMRDLCMAINTVVRGFHEEAVSLIEA